MSKAIRIALLLVASFLVASTAAAWNRGEVDRFAVLPEGKTNPEGIAVDHHGNVYVTTFVFSTDPGEVHVFDREGHFERTLMLAGSTSALLGIAFHPTTGDLLVVDFGAGNVLRVDPDTGTTSVFTAIGGGGLNALAFDAAGNVYISDSFRGIIYRTGPTGGASIEWVNDPEQLGAAGFPGFGANGIGFNNDESAFFIAHTGKDQIFRVPVEAGVAGVPEVFVNSVNGADGLFLDEHDNIWVAANQADEIVVVDKNGKAIAKLGDFGGLRHGAPVGLLFPASLARHRGWVYVTNLSLDVGNAVDSPWARQVTRHTISRIRARIPRVHD